MHNNDPCGIEKGWITGSSKNKDIKCWLGLTTFPAYLHLKKIPRMSTCGNNDQDNLDPKIICQMPQQIKMKCAKNKPQLVLCQFNPWEWKFKTPKTPPTGLFIPVSLENHARPGFYWILMKVWTILYLKWKGFMPFQTELKQIKPFCTNQTLFHD